jgi:5-(carboxyamino)imidazole ribonucleotide synthase
MFNLLGEMPEYAAQQAAEQSPVECFHWHDYHKTARAGRKIGHVTVLAESATELRARAAQLASELGVAAELNLGTILGSTYR